MAFSLQCFYEVTDFFFFPLSLLKRLKNAVVKSGIFFSHLHPIVESWFPSTVNRAENLCSGGWKLGVWSSGAVPRPRLSPTASPPQRELRPLLLNTVVGGVVSI